MKKSKKTFFGNSSKGKKAFPGGIKGPKQPKQTTNKGKKKQVKQMVIKKPSQPKTQAPMHKHVRQEHLVVKPKQPKFYSDAEFTRRLRRATM